MKGDAVPDPFGEKALRNPFATLAALRRRGPLVPFRFPIIGAVRLATTHQAAAELLKRADDFPIRDASGRTAGMRWWMPPVFRALAVNMLTFDDPDHARLRGIVEGAFGRRRILQMTPRIRAIADGLADGLFSGGATADLVARYCRLLPLRAICELLGLPDEDHPMFVALGARATDISGPFFLLRMIPALRRIRKYIVRRIGLAKATGHGGLVGELVEAQRAGAPVGEEEMVAMVFLLLMAGHETTTHLLSGAAHLCLTRPGLREIATGPQASANLAVEEYLRFVSPVQVSKPRHVAADMEFHGAALKKGERVMAMLASANADPAVNDEPERFDPARHPNRHIAFGTGAHFCLGHRLARIEAREGLATLFARWPNLALAVPPGEIRWRRRAGLRAIAELPVRAGA